MQTLSIDIETYSDVNLSKCGVYKYAESPDFEILLFGYSADGSDVTVIDLAQGEYLPQEIIEALTDNTVIKWAFNANFERVCLSRYLRDLGVGLDPFHDNHPLSAECARFLNPESWRCSMVWAATMGLPLSLEGVGAILGLEKQKLTEGKNLIKYFPCPALRRKQMAVARGITLFMRRTSGKPSNNITSAMWKPKLALRIDLPNFPCQKRSGMNTTSIRKSMTEVSGSTWIL